MSNSYPIVQFCSVKLTQRSYAREELSREYQRLNYVKGIGPLHFPLFEHFI